ncbi:TolC family protein [Rubripirellula obstinata]|nr:TolC family protein [Rubripirellula obstinata]
MLVATVALTGLCPSEVLAQELTVSPIPIDAMQIAPVQIDPVQIDPVQIAPVQLNQPQYDRLMIESPLTDPVQPGPIQPDPIQPDPIQQPIEIIRGDSQRVAAHWWDQRASESLFDQPTWVAFGLDTVLLDTLDNSPRIKIVASQASVAIERIVQQDAVFDARVLFDSRVNRNNDPVGNTLTTGGPPRLVEENLTASGGIQRTTRRGGLLDVSQQLGLANSNSTFFLPEEQGNSRLSLSLTQPLMSRSGQFYNERLLTQARIDSRVSWQDMRVEVETRISEVVTAYWRLYELRCHYLQTLELLERGKSIEAFLTARMDFDAGEIELAKVRGRIARRVDREVRLRAEIKRQQVGLAVLVGSEALTTAMSSMEMIPSDLPSPPTTTWKLRDAVRTGIENRNEIRSATAQLEAAALSIRVTRAELEPQLSAVFETYLAGLNGNNRVFNSWTDQFTQGGPGMAAGLQYELPYGRRAAKSRYREAQYRYQMRSEELREVVQRSQAEIEDALVSVNAAMESQETKKRLLETAVLEEKILTGRWEALAGDGSSVGVVLETLLDAQSRRTDAERELVSAQTEYVIAVVQLQRAMGTLLQQTGTTPIQDRSNNSVQFVQDASAIDQMQETSFYDSTQDQPIQNPAMQESVSQPLADEHTSVFAKPSNAKIVYIDPPNLNPPNLDQASLDQAGLDPPSKPQQESMQPLVAPRRDDVHQLIDTDWLEDAMYGDSKSNPELNEETMP